MKACGGLYFLFLAVCILLCLHFGSGCLKCPNPCRCSGTPDNSSCFVNCSSVGLQNIPHDLPLNTYLLDLSHNQIRILPQGVLSGLTSLVALNLQNNSLSALTRESLNDLTSLQELHISKNPWNCNCDLKWLQLWIKENRDKIVDWNFTLCTKPLSLQRTPIILANLSKQFCADDYVSCAWNAKEQQMQFVLWEHMESNIALENDTCAMICFSKGYFYASNLFENNSCLCAYENSANLLLRNITQWRRCMDACNNHTTEIACGRKINHGVFRAAPELQFAGLRPYFQDEEVIIIAIPKRHIADTFLWSFNDSTPSLLTSKLQVHHKYAISGKFWVTVVAQNGTGIDTYSFLVIVQKNVYGLELMCPKKVNISVVPNVTLGVISGNNLVLQMDVNSTRKNEQSDCFLSTSRMLCYRLFEMKMNWSNAQLACQKNHGDLIVVDSSVVQNDVHSILDGASGYFWIGLNSFFLKGTMLHVNHVGLSDSGYQHPKFKQPNVTLEQPFKDCVSINSSGDWISQMCRQEFGFICQYYNAERTTDSNNYLAGTAIFQHNSVNVVNDADIKNTTENGSEFSKFTILFPGAWIPADSEIISWEVVAQENHIPLRLQIYRPVCPKEEILNLPGCNKRPYSSCSSEACRSVISTHCPSALFQFCYFNQSSDYCRPLDAPCNWYDEYKHDIPARHISSIPVYSMVFEQQIAINESGKNLYQVHFDRTKGLAEKRFYHIVRLTPKSLVMISTLMETSTSVKKDDVIGFGFSLPAVNKLSDLPLVCKNSSLSSWRQSAMLFSVIDWSHLNSSEQKYDWLDYIWCDFRLHLSKTTVSKISSEIFNQSQTGLYNFKASVFNAAMEKSPLHAECLIEYCSSEMHIKLTSPTVIEEADGKRSLFVEQGKPVLISAKLFGDDIEGSVFTVQSTDGPNNMREECTGEECNNVSVSFSFLGRSRIQLFAQKETRTVRVEIEVFPEERISGAKILPQRLNRVLVGIPQIFTSSWTNGTNVTTTWIIDDLNKFGLKHHTYTVLFRKTGTYNLTMLLSNHVNEASESVSLLADEMRRLSDLQFIDAPSVVLFGSSVSFHISVLVDENIEAVVTWFIGTSEERTKEFSPPYNISRLNDALPQVMLEDEFSTAFTLRASMQKLKVTVTNNYDNIMTETDIDIRSLLTNVSISTKSTDLSNGFIEFFVSFSPHHETNFTVDWNDGSEPATRLESVDFTWEHYFNLTGIYNVSVFANNSVSTLNIWRLIVLQEKLDGLEIIGENCTEANVSFNLSTSVKKGNISTTRLDLDFGDNTTISINGTHLWNVSHSYAQNGKYVLTATASNPVSSISVSLTVEVYIVQILNILKEYSCYPVNSDVYLEAQMSFFKPGLFKFVWTLDGTEVKTDNNSLIFQYNTAGIHRAEVLVSSLLSLVNHTQLWRPSVSGCRNSCYIKLKKLWDPMLNDVIFSVCVQDPIVSVNLTASKQYIATGMELMFSYQVIGGTNVTATVLWEDKSFFGISNFTGNISKIFLTAGHYEVILNVSNEVSHLSSSAFVDVLDAVKDLRIITSSPYGLAIAKGHNVTYTAIYKGSNVTVLWRFGDAYKDGDEVSHIYNDEDDVYVDIEASNLINAVETRLKIVVQSPVEGVVVSEIQSVVLEGNPVWFNISERGNANTFRWMITPNLPGNWSSRLTDLHFFYQFTIPGIFEVFLMAENEVSSQNFTFPLLVAENISSLHIASNGTTNGFGPSKELLQFEGLISDGTSASRFSNYRCSKISWEILHAHNKSLVKSFSNSSSIEIVFDDGIYEIWLNVSNCAMNQVVKYTVNIIQRISNITLSKTKFPYNAVSTGEEVQIQASVSRGTNLTYSWRAHYNYPPKLTHTSVFSHTYDDPAIYDVYLEVSNPLNRMTATFTLYVQDQINGLFVEHLNYVVPFYVAYGKNSLFHASVINGSNVFYSWQFMDLLTGAKSDSKCTVHGTIHWNFTEIATYLLVLNASNYISWDHLNTTVHVILPVSDLEVYVENYTIPVNQAFNIYASAMAGDNDVSFKFDFGDGSPPSPGEKLNLTTSKMNYLYPVVGIYTILIQAINNATILSENVSLSVREPISGLQLLGLNSGSFIIVNVVYNLSALVNMGTEVDFNWTFLPPLGTGHSSGSNYKLIPSEEGMLNISITASNIISSVQEHIYVTAQVQPVVNLMLKNSGQIYMNENVILDINVVSGTAVQHSINFGDGNIYNTSSNSAQNVYSEPGEYVIKVLSFNKASQTLETLKITILELKCLRPNLAFVGDDIDETKFYRSRNVYIETEIETFGCNEYIVKYVWKMYQQTSCHDLNDSTLVKFPIARTPLLVLAPLTLKIGRYCVVCSASFIGTPLEHTVSTQIEIISTPLAVIITGGTFRSVSQASELVLDASSSFDPDLAATQQTAIMYNWTCSATGTFSESSDGMIVPKGEDNCFELRHGETIEFDSMNFIPGLEYNFTVVAYKDGKLPISTWQSITFEQSIIPTVTVSCVSCQHQFSLQTSSAHHLILLGSCDSCEGKDQMTYAWEAYCRNSSGNSLTPFPLNTVTTTTGSTGKYLVVRVGAMKSCYEYEFKLNIMVNGVKGFSKLVLFANKPPVNGICTMNFDGEYIYVLETLVRFQCSGWEDEDISQLVYTILAIRYNGGAKVDEFIIYRGTASEYEAYLPLGFRDNNYDMTLQIVVEDELGTFSVGLSRSIIVKLSPETELDTIQWLRNKTFGQLAELLKSSNPQLVADYAAGLITVLNEDSELKSTASEDLTFESRKEIRNNITRTVTSLSTQTLDEMKQVTTVFKQCVKIPSELQDSDLQNVSILKLIELAEQMPEYVDAASQTTFMTVTVNLMDIASYMVDSLNFVVYGQELPRVVEESKSINETYRKEMVEILMESALQLTSNVLDGKVEGEEPFFLNATALSSIGARTNLANMNSSVQNDGCFFEFPRSLFYNVSDDTEILYILVVAEQNPYTFGYTQNELATSGQTNISTRVPAFECKIASDANFKVCNVNQDIDSSSQELIKMVMAPSNRKFIPSEDTSEIAEISRGTNYHPRDGLIFKNFTLKGMQSIGLSIGNNNTDRDTAVYIMIVYDLMSNPEVTESTPYLDVFFHTKFLPNATDCDRHMRLTNESVQPQANHINYTIYIDSEDGINTIPKYYLNVSSYYKFHDVKLQVAVYYSACQFYDTEKSVWSSEGLRTSHETISSAAVCYSSHLTSFGSFVLNPPNVVDITDIKDINFSQNPVALIVVVVVFSLYLIAAIRCRFLDLKDLEKANSIPLCGANGSHKYEITIKTSPGIGSGTTANVGIIVYGYEARSGSKHLFKQDAFQRGSVDVFQISCDIELGSIYKIKLWHDNTGLDPAWNVSRIMIKDMQNEEHYFFLADTWLQVYPHDKDESCLIKTFAVASDEELSDFSLRFGNQLAYGWEDVHLWLSLIERPVRSNFTRVQRLTCCLTILFSFMVLCAFWYQNYEYDDDETFQIFHWQDVAVGIIVTVMVFPINILIVFCFKNSKCKVETVKQWTNRAQTAQTVEILNEILDGNTSQAYQRPKSVDLSYPVPVYETDDLQHTSDKQYHFEKDISDPQSHGLHKASGKVKSLDIGDKIWISEEMDYCNQSTDGDSRVVSDDTGISSAGEAYTPDITSNKSTLPGYDDDIDSCIQEDNFWNSLFTEDLIDKQTLQRNSRALTLKRTHKALFGTTDQSSELPSKCAQPSIKSEIGLNNGIENEPGSNENSNNTYLLPHQFVYIAYFLCYSGIVVSIFFIILYGHTFGVDKATRWLISMLISLGGSLFLIEPIKVIVFAVYVSLFTNQQVPEYDNKINDEPFIENYEHMEKRNKIRPPGGYALEQCKEQVKKSKRAKKMLQCLIVHSMLLSSLLSFVYVQRVPNAYWDVFSIKTVLQQNYSSNETYPFHFSTSTIYNVRTLNDIWTWTDKVLVPSVLTDSGAINLNFKLLGKARICQKRYTSETCEVSSNALKQCISGKSMDTSSYTQQWKNVSSTNSTPWSFTAPMNGIPLFGLHKVYDDSGYCAYLDTNNSVPQLYQLQQAAWLDNLTSLCFFEFTHFSSVTLGSIVSLILFEIDETGVVLASYTGLSTRIFLPHYITLDMIFMGMFGVVTIFLWCYEFYKIFRNRQHVSKYFKSSSTYRNMFVLLLSTVCCSIYIYRLLLLKHSMTSYMKSQQEFSSFYDMACVSRMLTVFSAILLTTLCTKLVRLSRFCRRYATFGKTLDKCWHLILGSTVIFLVLILCYAQVGYLVFGLNGGETINEFGNVWNSLYSLFHVLCGRLHTEKCFNAYPLFSVVYFFSFYFGVFLIVWRIFSSVLIHGYKDVRREHHSNGIADHEILEYLITRIKMRLGIIKPKQYRHRVHFEGMSTPSSRGSMNSLDSFGTCFTPGRISQCSDPSALSLSSSDSGLGTPSDHSLSLFDYLTIENPPSERPMDSMHLNFIYDRVSTYSVDMLLHRLDRVNKLGDDILIMENKLLEVAQKNTQLKVLQKQSKNIARAATTVTSQGSIKQQDNTHEHTSYSASFPGEESRYNTIIHTLFPHEDTVTKGRLSERSSSYSDRTAPFHSENVEQVSAMRKRPYSDEGARPLRRREVKTNPSTVTKKSAW